MPQNQEMFRLAPLIYHKLHMSQGCVKTEQCYFRANKLLFFCLNIEYKCISVRKLFVAAHNYSHKLLKGAVNPCFVFSHL